MESNKKLTNTKRVMGVLAIVMVVAVLLTGTFAWTNFNQHKTNEFSNLTDLYDATLIEDFEEVTKWTTTGNPTVKKVISVKNNGVENQYGNVYVRLMLKEYLEHAGVFKETDERYMIDTNGEFYVYTTQAEAEAAYPGHVVKELYDSVSGRKGFFVQTQEKDPNGQYGRYVVQVIDGSHDVSPLIDGTVRASEDAMVENEHNNKLEEGHNHGECAYPGITWGAGESADTVKFREWVQLNFGEKVLLSSEWSGTAVEAWVLDEATGWIYWGTALEVGDTTPNLLESVTLLQDSNNFYYALHVDMEAISADELEGDTPAWAGVSDAMKNALLAKEAQFQEEKQKETPVAEPPAFNQQPVMFSLTGTGYYPAGTTEVQVTPVFHNDAEAGTVLLWESDNPNVTVDNTGKCIFTNGATKAVITAKTEDGLSFRSVSLSILTGAATNPTASVSMIGEILQINSAKSLFVTKYTASGLANGTSESVVYEITDQGGTNATITAGGLLKTGDTPGVITVKATVNNFDSSSMSTTAEFSICDTSAVESEPFATSFSGNYADLVPMANPNNGPNAGESKENPYKIESVAQMKKLAVDMVSVGGMDVTYGKYFELCADLDYTGATGIGSLLDYFYGNFDGNGHVIKNLDGMLFISVSHGVVENLGREGGNATYGDTAGGITRTIKEGAVIRNCYNTANVTAEIRHAGGITGAISTGGGRVENCYNTGTITSNNRAGGLVGVVTASGTIKNCYNTGNVSVTTHGVGGFVGYVSGSLEIVNSYSFATEVKAGTKGAGSVIGDMTKAASYKAQSVKVLPGVASAAGDAEQVGMYGWANATNKTAVETLTPGQDAVEDAGLTTVYAQSKAFAIQLGSAYKYQENSTPVLV